MIQVKKANNHVLAQHNCVYHFSQFLRKWKPLTLEEYIKYLNKYLSKTFNSTYFNRQINRKKEKGLVRTNYTPDNLQLRKLEFKKYFKISK